VYESGDEPDPRFTLANERTFLAWVGAGLALISAGVGLDSLASALNPGLRLAASVVLILGGMVSAAQAWFGWMATAKSLRNHRPLPATTFAIVLPVVLGIAAVLILIGMFA
jgi:putative membrane protein